MARRARKSKSTYDKLKEIDPQFLENIQSAAKENLDGKIVELTKYQEEISEAKKADPDLQRLQEQVRFANAGYRETQGAIKLKIKYVVELLKSKGQ